MPSGRVRREPVWSGRLRALHWALAASTLLLLVSGWLLSVQVRPLPVNLRSMHVSAGVLLTLALMGRLILLLAGRGTELLRDFRTTTTAMLGMLRFYVTAGRSPLPAYYAHNPFWAPLYLLLLATLALQAASGLSWQFAGAAGPEYFLVWPWLFGWTLPEWHYAGYRVIAVFTFAHVFAVFLHDWKGTGAEISAMLSGYKIFIISLPSNVLPVAWKKPPKPSDPGKSE